MEILLAVIIAYLLGSIPSALWIGQLFYHTDIREHGSGNLGTTNTFRVLGKKAGSVVLMMDMLKGTFAVLLPLIPYFSHLPSWLDPIVLGVVAIVGHMYPVFAQFKGGKAVATSAGVLLGYAPLFLLILAVVFFITLKLSKMVSLTSMTAAVVAFFLAMYRWIQYDELYFFVVISIMAFFILYRHRENIQRIRNGTESKVTWL